MGSQFWRQIQLRSTEFWLSRVEYKWLRLQYQHSFHLDQAIDELTIYQFQDMALKH